MGGLTALVQGLGLSIMTASTLSCFRRGGWITTAVDINDSGAVVGGGDDGTGNSKGFIYNGGVYTKLLPPGWLSAGASKINERGMVMVMGRTVIPQRKGLSTVMVSTLSCCHRDGMIHLLLTSMTAEQWLVMGMTAPPTPIRGLSTIMVPILSCCPRDGHRQILNKSTKEKW